MTNSTTRVAIITGAGNEGGIGYASARKLALEGVNVVLTDIASKESSLNRVATQLAKETGVRALPMICDVTDDASIEICVERTLKELGRIDILFNNAGIGAMSDLVDTDIDLFDLMYRINVRGPVVFSKAVIPAMQTQGGGVIINNASNAGVYGVKGQTHYCASKHAVIGFTKSLASEVGKDGIRVLAVCPGLIETDMWKDGLEAMGVKKPVATMAEMAQQISLDRWASPAEVGDFIAFAASDKASYLTGTYYHIHGGFPVDGLV